jgi:N-acetylglutamate synthase-like GNAT family acetyltransferase
LIFAIRFYGRTFREASRVEGDDDAQHFGVLHNGKLVSCLSVFMLDASVCQIRKFATLEAYQGQGFGGFLLQSVLEKMAEPGYMKCVWMHVSGPSTSTTGSVSVPKANTSSKKGWSTCVR